MEVGRRESLPTSCSSPQQYVQSGMQREIQSRTLRKCKVEFWGNAKSNFSLRAERRPPTSCCSQTPQHNGNGQEAYYKHNKSGLRTPPQNNKNEQEEQRQT